MVRDTTSSIRVLYVEDIKDLQSSVALGLHILGYEVACADDGQQAIEKAENWHPDIILMDVRMPVMSGDQAIRILRRKPTTANTPIFVLSVYADLKTQNLCKEAGADKFFTKPFDIHKIDADIRKVVEKRITKVDPIVKTRKVKFKVQ